MHNALPLSTSSRLTAATPLAPEGGRATVAVIGAAGVVGTVTHECLHDHFAVTGLDTAARTRDGNETWWTVGSIVDEHAVGEVIQGATYVVLAATGVHLGWQGLLDVEITGTKVVYDVAAAAGVQRVILVSSNHVSGMTEVDRWEGREFGIADPFDPPRPDGLYACSKVFAESIARAHSEIHGLKTSILRLGAMRLEDDPVSASDGPRPTEMSEEVYQDRMKSVWMRHSDWRNLLTEEFASTETYRLRYASTPSPAAPWTQRILTWSISHAL